MASVSEEHEPTDPVQQVELTPWRRRLTWIAVAGLVAAYAVLSNYSSSNPSARGLGVVLSLGPVLLIAGVLLWRWAHPLVAALLSMLCAATLWRYWAVLEENFEWADLVQQVGAFGLIAAGFIRSLYGGREPLCAQLAKQLHGELTPPERVYTRRATAVWGVFYVTLAAAILILFFTASRALWSIFVNFATFGLIAGACLVDVALRRRLLPHRPQVGLLTALRQSLIG